MAARFGAEVAGTGILVWIGVGAELIQSLTGALGNPGVAAGFGLAVAVAVWLTVPVSGAHLNPAVTFGLWAAGRLPGRDVAPYWTAQVAGAALAAWGLSVLSGVTAGFPVTRPHLSLGSAILMELALTMALMSVVLRLPASAARWRVAMTVGVTVALEAAVGGGVSGASMNPARSLGPAWVAGEAGALWVYLIVPLAGAVLAVCFGPRPASCRVSGRVLGVEES